jgi:hypothetical protein
MQSLVSRNVTLTFGGYTGTQVRSEVEWSEVKWSEVTSVFIVKKATQN